MGQNQSRTGGSKIIVIDDSLQILGYHNCAESTEPGHSRPIPPPQSRDAVMSQLRDLRTPIATPSRKHDSTLDGLKRGINYLEEETALGLMCGAHNSGRALNKQDAISATTTMPGETAPDVLPPPKKRRLFANEHAVEIAHRICAQARNREGDPSSWHSSEGESVKEISANYGIQEIHSNPSETQADAGSNESSTSANKVGPFPFDSSDDEGYHTYSPTSANASFDEDDEDGLVNELAKLHQQSVANKDGSAETQILTPPDSPTLRKIQEEDESAEQSRRLRERKQSGLKVNNTVGEDLTTPNDVLEVGLVLSDDDVAEQYKVEKLKGSGVSRGEYGYFPATANHRSARGTFSSYEPSRYERDERSLHDSDCGSDSSERNCLLDVAQSYATKARPLPQPRLRRINARTPRYRQFPNAINPASRLTAERFRTQSRHLESKVSGMQPRPSPIRRNQEAEARLRELTSRDERRTTAAEYREPSAHSLHLGPQEPPKFYGIDLGPGASQSQSYPRNSVRRTASSPLEDDESEIPADDEAPKSGSATPNGTSGPDTPARSLSMLEMMAKRAEERQKPASAARRPTPVQTLDLGVGADIDHDDEQAVREEHERLKEQQKDLEAIESTCLAIANIRALGPLTAPEIKEEHEVRKFISVVLDAKKSGKDRRTRMTSIRANFGRRLDREDAIATEERVQEEFVILLGEHRVKRLNDLRDPLDDLVNQLRVRRSILVDKRHSSKNKKNAASHKKQVRFAASVLDKVSGRFRRDIADGTIIDLDGPKRKPKPPTKTDREIALLEEKLRLFEGQGNLTNFENTSLSQSKCAQDSESEESEEEGGAEYVFGAGRDLSANPSFTAPASFPIRNDSQDLEIEQDLDVINRLENARQQEDSARVASRFSDVRHGISEPQRSTQRPDLELVERMKQAQRSRQNFIAAENEDGSNGLPFDDLADLSDSSEASAASTTSSSSASSDHQAVKQTFKYTVVGRFAGIDTYHPVEHYHFKTFHDLDRANKYIYKVTNSLAADQKQGDGLDWKVVTRSRHGIIEQGLSLGEDEAVQSKIWIEREMIEVDLGKIVASKARRAILGEEKGIWVVDWEKTVTKPVTFEAATTINGTTNEPTISGLTEQEDEDLFGSSSPSPPAPAEQNAVEVTHPKPHELQMFTTAALANRAAKKLYIAWLAQFYPEKERPYYGRLLPASGSRYEGMLGQVDLALEQELERLGDWGLGVWEEEIEKHGAGGKEMMKVWVRRVGVQGPQN